MSDSGIAGTVLAVSFSLGGMLWISGEKTSFVIREGVLETNRT